MKWWKAVIVGALALGFVALAFVSLRKRPAPATEVQLAKAHRGSIARIVSGAGKVQAATTVKISSNLSGDLTELLVKVGDPVVKGQVLARIDRRRFEAAAKQYFAAQSAERSQIQVQQVELDHTERELERVLSLQKKGMTSEAETERARSDRDAASARLAASRQRFAQAVGAYDQAQNDLTKTILSSPIDGTVIELSREVGERVRGSDFSEDVVMTVAAMNAMEVKMEVGEHEIVHLRKGQRADIALDALEGQNFQGVVTEIAGKGLVKNPGTEAEVTTFPVTVTLEQRPDGVLPGMSAEVRISTDKRDNALLVPIQAVTVRAERLLPDAKSAQETGTVLASHRGDSLAKVVFVVDAGNQAHVRRVRTGISSDSDVEVLDGLAEGDRVVEGPYRTLSKELQDSTQVREADPAGPSMKAERG